MKRNGCRTWIRTMTDCSRGSRATITPFGKTGTVKVENFATESSFGGRINLKLKIAN